MAKPPEPLQEVLPKAALVVDARVKEVVSTAPPIARPDAPEEWRDVGVMSSEQVLVLEIARVLKGTLASKTVTVKKPVAPYAVKVGTKGAWLLDTSGGEITVLGRYGPDSWNMERVEDALR
jgi:hypothetical protein